MILFKNAILFFFPNFLSPGLFLVFRGQGVKMLWSHVYKSQSIGQCKVKIGWAYIGIAEPSLTFV